MNTSLCPPSSGIQYDGPESDPSSSIIALFVESLLFGAFTITFANGALALLHISHRGKPSTKDWGILLASTMMYILALAHLGLSLKLILVDFDHEDQTDDTPVNEFGSIVFLDPLDGLNTARIAIYIAQVLLGDIFMIYRLFIVWNDRKRILIIPLLLFLASIALGALVMYGGWIAAATGWAKPFFALSFSNNMLFTVLVMWRVLSPTSNRWVGVPRGISQRLNMFYKVAAAIVQSAAIYSVASLVLVVTSTLEPDIWQVCTDVFPPLMGLVFSFIVIRIARRSTSEFDAIPTQARVHGHRQTMAYPRNSLPSPTLDLPQPTSSTNASEDTLSHAIAVTEGTGCERNVISIGMPKAEGSLSVEHADLLPPESDVLGNLRTSKIDE
ncbi:hypothetical protein C8Q73DRAFT_721889 [Cubamyces lactineus]|nr:hypothetical protein C8Q73DRAFT_721889 [Cubamyces lactineus]